MFTLLNSAKGNLTGQEIIFDLKKALMDKKDLKKIEKIVKSFFQKMTLEVDFEVKSDEENLVKIFLKADEAQILIGEQGKMLFELQKILGKIIKKQVKEEIYLEIDINEYRQNKEQYFKDLAQSLADEVVSKGEERILLPMPPYIRRIIHLELASREDVKTESIGEEESRRIVIKPA